MAHKKILAPIMLVLCTAVPFSILAQGRAAPAPEENTSSDDLPPKIRIGTYDNRAIAIAFARSKYHQFPKKKMQEYQKAKEAGDTERVEELEQWGKTQQRKLHFQGFGRFPVDNILKHIEDELPAIAQKEGLDAIVFGMDYSADNVEIVDVTMELVELFDPSEKTLGIIASLRKKGPIPFETLDKLKADH